MSLAIVRARARIGLQAPEVAVEVHLSNGLPGLTMVGMAETAVKESKDRVRSAIINSHFDFPARRITVNLAPADLPKSGGQFDLPIALGILAASSQLAEIDLTEYEFLGELALNGDLRPVAGVLSAALACGATGATLCCPEANAEEALLGGQARVLPSASLLQLCERLQTPDQYATRRCSALYRQRQEAVAGYDLTDVRGQRQARRALEIAAAGNHHLLFYGPPGTGKSMLAQRLPGILPPLTDREALEVACIQSLAGSGPLRKYPLRPFSAPHHTASAVALVGGGPNPRPGEISKAHNGVLFLDELPEFQRRVLEVLREPIETGQIRISRARAQIEYPSRFLMVAAMNPCPCGYYGHTPGGQSPPRGHSSARSQVCSCSPEQVRRYRARLSGPLLDRIDMHVPVLPLKQGELFESRREESSACVRKRVCVARDLQHQRQNCSNSELSNLDLAKVAALSISQQSFMENAMLKLGYSLRALHRVHKLALTIADLEGSNRIADHHLMEAFSYRNLDREEVQ